MEVTLHSTSKIVTLVVNNHDVQARIWEGKTASGIPVHAYVTRIAVDKTEDTSEFEHELQEHRAPSRDIQAIPLRMII